MHQGGPGVVGTCRHGGDSMGTCSRGGPEAMGTEKGFNGDVSGRTQGHALSLKGHLGDTEGL